MDQRFNSQGGYPHLGDRRPRGKAVAATAKLNKRILEMAGRLNVSLPVGATILPDVPDAPLWAAKLAQSSWSSVFHGELRNDTSQSTNAVLHPLLDDSQNPFWLALQLCIFGSSYNSHREGATWGSNDDLQCQPKNDGGKLESNREQKQCNKSYDSTPLLVIMESFGAWLNIRKTHPSYDKWLSEDVKLSAFLEMFSKSDVRLFNIVFDLYQLDTCKSEAILPFIRQAVADKRYGHACQAVSAFGLQDRFEVTDILFPLIVLNKRKLVKRYLEKGHHLSEIRLKLLRFLDGVCRENLRTKSNSVVPELIRYLEIPDVDQQHSSIQHIYRFALKLAKKYQLPDDECKNVFAVQRFAVLRFLIFKNYHEKSIHQEDWVDLISSFVGKRLELQLKALESMVRQNDVVTARHLSINWGVNSKKLPTDVSKALITGQFTPRRRTNIRDNQLHDSLSGSTNDQTYSPDVLKTHFVDSPSEFGTFIDSVQKAAVVGLDSEWKPVFLGNLPEVALLQVATRDAIYLLDVLKLKLTLSSYHWTRYVDDVFANSAIVKLGFSIDGDWDNMARICPSLTDISQRSVNITDLSVVCRNLLKLHPMAFPCGGEIQPKKKGLTNFMEMCCGRRLDKKEQFSNWERRPLRPSQIRYAALDSYCLLDMYDILMERCRHLDIDFEKMKDKNLVTENGQSNKDDDDDDEDNNKD